MAANDGTVRVETFPARADRPALDVPVRPGMTLDDLLCELEIPEDTEAILVNGAYVRPNHRLEAGDHVRIIPFMSDG